MIGLDAALDIMKNVVRPLAEIEERPLLKAQGAVAAHGVRSERALPAVPSAVVDGFAFRFADIEASGSLQIPMQSLAGEDFRGDLPPGAAIPVIAGESLPFGSDTVVRQEHSRLDGGTLFLEDIVEMGAFVAALGQDIHAGDLALPAGRRLRPQDIALLGSLGLSSVPVRRRLRIALTSARFSSRDRDASDQHETVPDINGSMLKQLATNLDADVTVLPPLRNDEQATSVALQTAAEHFDAILTSGTAPRGGRDPVVQALEKYGRVHFSGVAIEPGRAIGLGQLSECFLLRLPANTVSAMIGFFLLGRPLLDCIAGKGPGLPQAYTLSLAEPITKDRGLRGFPCVSLRHGLERGLQVVPFRDQASHLLTSLVAADGVLDLPIGETRFDTGREVDFMPFQGLM